MDVLSHALIGNLVFKELPMSSRWLPILLGVLPDLCAFAWLSRPEFLKRALFFKRFPKSYLPQYVFNIYNFTHSLVIWAVIFTILWFLAPKFVALAYISWGIHIVIDIFTHNSKANFAIRIFWPISKVYFDGISWWSKKFVIIGYSIIALLYLIFYF